MADTVISPNMNMPVPVVGQAPGPDWASDLNICLSLVDTHDHAAGNGVPITPSGMSINAELPCQNQNITGIRSLRLQDQGSPIAEATDLRCLYSVDVDLYFNDGNGNQIQITDAGGVAGTPGSIANLVPPASATYVDSTPAFVWQSDANTAADMDFGAAVFRNLTPSSFGLTVQPPTLSSNYTITLPALPASQKFMTLDNLGNMSAPWAVDGSTIVINANTVKVPAGGITSNELASDAVITVKIQDGAVTPPKLSFINGFFVQQTFTSRGNYTVAASQENVMLYGIGGGGGGGSGGGSNGVGGIPGGGGGAGGSGAIPSMFSIPVIAADVLEVRIGAAGVGGPRTAVTAQSNGTSGTAGGSSYLALNATVTISNASPAVFTTADTSRMRVRQRIYFTTSGALPTGLTVDQVYFVSSIDSSTTFKVSATVGGANVNTSSAGSGVHTQHLVLAEMQGGGGGSFGYSGAGADPGGGGVASTTSNGTIIIPGGNGNGGSGANGTATNGGNSVYGMGGLKSTSSNGGSGGGGGAGLGGDGADGGAGAPGANNNGTDAADANVAYYGAGGGGGGGCGDASAAGGHSGAGGDGTPGIVYILQTTDI